MVDRQVPFIELRPYVKLVGGFAGAAFADDVMGLLGAKEFIGGGTTVTTFENSLAMKLGAKHVVACANGTDALVLALRALGIDRHARVAIPNLTFWATYEAVCQVGATPVILDVDPDDLQMSFKEFSEAHSKHRFNAAILVHLYGWCSSRLDEFRTMCHHKRIPLVEDGAQAFGTTTNGESVFKDAEIATLSFHPAKVLGAIGDAGAVLCKNKRTADRVRLLANHGRVEHYSHIVPGWNSRMDAIQAAWLLRALEVSDEVVAARRAVAKEYDDRVRRAGFHDTSMLWQEGANGYLNVTLVKDTIATSAHLARVGIDVGRVYPRTIADQPGANGALVFGDLTHSRAVARRVINLPLFYGITDAQVAHVVEAMG